MLVVHQYETRQHSGFEQLMHLNRQYCEQHGYIYLRVIEEYDITPYWVKIFLLRETLKNPDIDYVVWMDSDSVVHNTQNRYESLFDNQRDAEMIISYDEQTYSTNKVANAGVFIVKNTPSMRRLMDEWVSHYDETRWFRNSEGAWRSVGPWEGLDYEQGILNAYLLPRYPTIRILHPSVLCCHSIYPPPQTFACHFNGSMNKDPILRKYLLARYAPQLTCWTLVGIVVITYGLYRHRC